MRESEKRIREYQKMLPHLKEKVSTIAFLFVISIVMMTAATFAWISVSSNPEIEGIATNVSANGNLEIALSNTEGTEPNESQVGDSLLAMVDKNLTWGNLVNLSDNSYGLSKITLRPASLNASALLTNPLYAAEYDSDGRVETLNNAFAYTNYNSTMGTFNVPSVTQYGVRGISSVSYTYASGTEAYYEREDAANDALIETRNDYAVLVSGDGAYIPVVCDIIGDFLTDKFGGSLDSADYGGYTKDIYDMMLAFKDVMDLEAETYLQIANFQLYIADPSRTTYYESFDEIAGSNEVSIVREACYKEFVSDYGKLEDYLKEMKGYRDAYVENKTPVLWSDMEHIINFMAKINTTTVDGTPVGSIGADEAASIALSGGTHTAIITEGALRRMESRIGEYMNAKGMTVTATVGITVDLKANVTTSANNASDSDKITAVITNSGSSGGGRVATAAETYGMALDFWVRTNADNDYLILEGNTLTTQVQVVDKEGNPCYTNEAGTVIVMKTDEGGNSSYYLEDGTAYTPADDEVLAILYETVVTGYEGENRIWDDEVLTEYSATQGSGSCFVFYSDSPQDQAQSLDLLEAMRVVFIDDKGTLLAYADLNTESHFAQSGRVTVPLELRSTSINLGQDESGKSIFAITPLYKGEAKRITAIIYVDGTTLENTDVLADADIQGQLNIQFGSSTTLEAIVDDNIYFDEVHVTGTVTPDEFDYAENPDMELKSNVNLTVEGANPTKVTARFIRQINSTQGTRQQEIEFKSNGDGTWSSVMEYASPGDYVLRSVYLDGVEYELDEEVNVTISGFSINNVGWDHEENYAKVMSAQSYDTERITVSFGGLAPSRSVQGIFSNADNQQVNVNFIRGTSNWTGYAKFATSGVFTLQYLIIDGEYYEIPASMQKTIDLSLGMKAQVQISETSWEYKEPKTVKVYVTVMDNTGNELTGLENVSLQYLSQSSTMQDNGLFTELTWRPETGCYEGNFDVNYAGAYEFAYLTIGNSSINSATAPIITAIPPIPPTFHENITDASIFAYGQEVGMKIALKDSYAVAQDKITATIYKLDESGEPEKDAEGNPITFKLTASNSITHEEDGEKITDWTFTLPTTSELGKLGYDFGQLGTWRMSQVSIIGAYVDGEISDEENPYIIDFDDIVTTIDDEMTVSITGESQTYNDKKFAEPAVADEGLVLEIRGAGGEIVTSATKVVVTYKLTNRATSTGNTVVGYTNSTDAINSYSTVKAILMPNPDNANQYILDTENSNNALNLLLAGTYTFSEVSFEIDGTNYTAKADGSGVVKINDASSAPSYTLEWQAPVVQIKQNGISPASSSANTRDDGDTTYVIYQQASVSSKTNARSDEYNCTVYFHTATKTVGNRWTGYATAVDAYTLPTVTTKLSNVNAFSTATMIVVATGTESDVNVSGSCGNVTYTYSGTTENTQTIGVLGSTISTNRYVLGMNSKGSYITITGTVGNGTSVTYVFKLVNPVTINNPY